ncbi:Defence response isoform 1 [Cucumis melo var. makuwa]|uniref:Defence response isoform 1 n=1 Tax=Cucumis melo var. makuwa TaxID=1194695 RepID=A0A5D3CRJ2_CUCMM|nr:Defence response isoform 1 [Cucumis melo var. makuwa]
MDDRKEVVVFALVLFVIFLFCFVDACFREKPSEIIAGFVAFYLAHALKTAPWLSVPQFGDWDQKGQLPDYSLDFSKLRENRKQNKRDVSRASLGNEEELIAKAAPPTTTDSFPTDNHHPYHHQSHHPPPVLCQTCGSMLLAIIY